MRGSASSSAPRPTLAGRSGGRAGGRRLALRSQPAGPAAGPRASAAVAIAAVGSAAATGAPAGRVMTVAPRGEVAGRLGVPSVRRRASAARPTGEPPRSSAHATAARAAADGDEVWATAAAAAAAAAVADTTIRASNSSPRSLGGGNDVSHAESSDSASGLAWTSTWMRASLGVNTSANRAPAPLAPVSMNAVSGVASGAGDGCSGMRLRTAGAAPQCEQPIGKPPVSARRQQVRGSRWFALAWENK
mmetsp:Transcript_17126/g.54249  ORF Transcript_17126/g.54249 Transcript_17126/m.54249 type:complete len:247 (-) Transcript_17126:7-747(-)|eukprot:scaffold17387_cov84-Isochrysis_galbana.AAC.1